MTEPRRISLPQQAEALHTACTRQHQIAAGGTVKGLRGKPAEEYDLQRLQAVTRTITWLQDHEDEIRAFLALTPADRAVIVSHGHLVAQLANQMKAKEAAATKGGPAR